MVKEQRKKKGKIATTIKQGKSAANCRQNQTEQTHTRDYGPVKIVCGIYCKYERNCANMNNVMEGHSHYA